MKFKKLRDCFKTPSRRLNNLELQFVVVGKVYSGHWHGNGKEKFMVILGRESSSSHRCCFKTMGATVSKTECSGS